MRLIIIAFLGRIFAEGLQPWQQDPLLVLIFTFAVGVRHLTDLVALEEEHLGNAFIGIQNAFQ